MGLIRTYLPTADGSVSALGFPATTTYFAHIDDPIGTYIARGSSGGVETDIADDSNFIRVLVGFPPPAYATFKFPRLVGDDDVGRVNFLLRAKGAAAAFDLVRYKDSTATYTILHSATAGTLTGSFANYSFQWNLAAIPELSDLDPDDDWFGVGTSTAGLDISRFAIQVLHAVGPTYGTHMRKENWRYCDQCGFKRPYSLTQRPVAPHPQAGLVVCARCFDKPDHDTIKIMSKRVPDERTDVLY